jgi:hypothetical protein
VSAWSRSVEPPSDFRVHERLAKYLDVDEGWLIKNKGEPPRPELWHAWIAQRHREQRAPKVPTGKFKTPATGVVEKGKRGA